MTYVLTDEQYADLCAYFEFALTAISDEEQAELVHMELPLRDMLRSLKPDR